MIVHIVFFKFKDENKAHNIAQIKQMLEALPGQIEQIKRFEIGEDINGGERACDLSLYSTFEDEKALKEYAVHPKHLEVVEVIKQVSEYTKVVDYRK